MKVLFVYPGFQRHADDNPELHDVVPMNKYLGSPSLGIASLAALTPAGWEIEYHLYTLPGDAILAPPSCPRPHPPSRLEQVQRRECRLSPCAHDARTTAKKH